MRKASKMQLKAISHGEGPARVLAGPGSGKTFTIIQRIYYLIRHHHISPSQILCVTFTKAAAMEMQQRFYREFPEISTDYPDETVSFGTLHSLCFQIARQSGAFYQFSLVSERTKRTILKQLLANEGILQDADYDRISQLLSLISRKKSGLEIKESVFFNKEQFETIFPQYEAMLKERRLLDFDDMICETCSLLEKNQKLREKWQSAFSHILVDEFQDMNEMQYRIIRMLAEPENNLFIVGDDDQSIYGFRGAAPGIMKQFETDYPDMTALLLTENYRSGSNIVSLAAQMITENKDRLLKDPVPIQKGGKIGIYYQESRKKEEALLLTHLKSLSRTQLNDSAIIVRTNREAFQYVGLLKQEGIPICEKLQEDAEDLQHFIMEDVCAFLRFIREGALREDFLKFMNKPEKYLTRQALSSENITEDLLLRFYQKNASMKERVKAFWEQLTRAAKMPPSLAVRYFRQVIGYDRYLEETAKTESERKKWLEDGKKIQLLFREMKAGEAVDDFVRRKDRERKQGVSDKTISFSEGVSVLTMHGVKGLEFTHVFLPDLNEGVIPDKNCRSPESMEEERRLLYVAITRAKMFLYLYYTRERNRKPTRFLKKLLTENYSFSPSISSSNSTPSKYSSKASATISYSSSSSI